MRQRWVAAVAIISCAFGIHHYLSASAQLLRPSAWMPMRLEVKGALVHSAAGQRTVLTMAPALPLEGGASVYPELSTGLYGFRVSDMLTASQRHSLKIAGEAELEGWIESPNPPAILLGGAPELESGIVRCAVLRHYTKRHLPQGLVMLVPPTESAALAGAP